MADAQENRFMRDALEMAHQARAAGEVPVGAVLVLNGEIIARAHNQPIRLHVKMESCKLYAFRFGGPGVRIWK